MGLQEIACRQNNIECKYYPNCFQDTHHIYPQRLARLACKGASVEERRLIREFINSPDRTVVVCRNIHDSLDKMPAPQLPSIEELRKLKN
jgi:hypothetical protein